MNNNKTVKILLVTVIVLLLVVIGIMAYVIIGKNNEDKSSVHTSVDPSMGLTYEANLATDEDALQKMVDDMIKKADEGYISVQYQNSAFSEDGKNFSCSIFNAASNNYDMYIGIYTDASLEEEIYLSGLIPPGSGIDSFTINNALEKGEHSCVMVETQVEDDHETLHGQIAVELVLAVQ